MFFRLLTESFIRQKRRKALAGIAILLGTTAVTAMLALATTIGDRIHRELAVYGANIVVTPKAADLEVKVGGVNVQPATGNAYLKESDLEKLKTIFWANNITAISPELRLTGQVVPLTTYAGITARWSESAPQNTPDSMPVALVGYWFNHPFGTGVTGAPQLHPSWKLEGKWPSEHGAIAIANSSEEEIVIGRNLANRFQMHVGDSLLLHVEHVGKIVGIVTAGDSTDNDILYALDASNKLIRPLQSGVNGEPWSQHLSRVEISAKTRPEDAFARLDPDKLSGKQRDTWYCRPYANSIAYQIREAIPGAQAEQVRRVEQSEGTVLQRISGLMWLVSAAALERRAEIGLMRSLGASKAAIASLFYAESSLLALAAGIIGYLAGSALAWWLGGRIFPSDGPSPILNLVLLPVIVAMAILVAIAGSTPAIRSGLKSNVSNTLRGDV
jgi:putative ABC transport system permease protein